MSRVWRRLGAALGAEALLAVALGCATGPPRPVVPDWRQGSEGLRVDARERALSDEAEEVIAELQDSDSFLADPALDALINQVLERMVPPLDEFAPEFRVRVLRNMERNANALPNGTILVSLGLIAVLENEAELAALLGHELAHLVFRHALVLRLHRDLTPSTVARKRLSRELEQEADVWSTRRLAEVGYHPMAMNRMLGLLDPDARPAHARVPAWESHADKYERIVHAGGLARELHFERARVGTERYESAISGVLLLAAELELEADRLEPARAAIDRYLARFPDSGRAYYLKGELARRGRREGRSSEEARAAYERAVELAPTDAEALRTLGLLLREAGELERARDLLERYLRAAPDAVDRSVIERYLAADERRGS